MHTYIVINFVNQSHYHIIQSSSNSQDPNTGNGNIGSYCEFFYHFPTRFAIFAQKHTREIEVKGKENFQKHLSWPPQTKHKTWKTHSLISTGLYNVNNIISLSSL